MAEYFLHVELIVESKASAAFEEKMKTFLNRGEGDLKGFKYIDPSIGLDLVLALRTPKHFKYSGYKDYQSAEGEFEARDDRGPAEVYRYVHLWRLESDREFDIAQAMARSADDELYTEIDALVQRETQNLVLRVEWLAGQPAMGKGNHFTRIVREFTTKDLGTYLFKVGALFPVLEKKGYNTLGTFQNVTGPLDVVVEFWQSGNDDLKGFTKALAGTPAGFKANIVDPTHELAQAEVSESYARATYAPTI